jgi:S-DNA-T family DNA segregation ATPase FtsK/SpoIIIE
MRLHLTIARSARPDAPVDVDVDAPDGATARELAAALQVVLDSHPNDRAPSAAGGAPGLSVRGGRLPDEARVGRPPLVDGAALTLGSDGPGPERPLAQGSRLPARTPVTVAVVHGPDAGHTIQLPPGVHTVGRSPDADVVLDDARLSRVHAELRVSTEGVWVRDLASTNGTRLDGIRIGTSPSRARAGARVALGDTVLALRPPTVAPAAVERRADGTTAVNRRPRPAHDPAPVTIALPTPPDQPRPVRVPWVAALVPVPFAALLAAFFGPTMLAFALMGPMVIVGTAVADRFGARRRYAAESRKHARHRAAALERAEAAAREEEWALRRDHPDPADVLATACWPGARLWERRRDDADAMAVTVGSCATASRLRVVRPTGDDGPEHLPLRGVPCVVPLPSVGVLGLCGDRPAVLGATRAVLGQLCTLHSPLELDVSLLAADPGRAADWVWMGRLPHLRHADGSARHGSAVVGGEGDARVRAVVAELRDRVAARESGDGPGGRWHGPWSVIVIDGADQLRGVAGVAELLERGPSVGVLCVALADGPQALPSEAGAVLDLTRPDEPRLDLPGADVTDLVVDRVGAWWVERLSRALAPLRDAAPTAVTGRLPAVVDLPSLLDFDPTDAGAVAALWRDRPHTTRVPVGTAADETVVLDLATDGPHVLVGGTTGSGKSEFLRTLVTSLAAQNRPEHLSFVLVDYKGGAAFRDCAGLPHVAGLVTDLDEHLASRALTSLRAELARRERLFAAAGVADFVAYEGLGADAPQPLARLVVVVDEFRALAEEQPAFVDGVVRFASLGRSLGVHVVLATQRPSGVVNADIRANVNLRVALRMRDVSDSLDVIDSPVAADLDPSLPGRAYASVAGAAPARFQSALVSTPLTRGAPVVRARRTPFAAPPGPWLPAGRADAQGGGASVVTAIVDAARRAAELTGAVPARPAWLPPLPTSVEASGFADAPGGVAVGLVDHPERQAQQPLVLDPRQQGSWAVVGGVGSGRTTTLLTFAAAVTRRWASSDLHLYAVSGGSLAALADLPHCGAHVAWDDLPRLDRLAGRLTELVAARRRALTASGHPSMQAWWAADPDAPPPVLLFVDDWDLLVRHADLPVREALPDRLLAVLREGESVGLIGVVTGDRTLLVGRTAAVLSRRLLLRAADPTDALLAGVPVSSLPSNPTPGRGVLGEGTEVQVALPGPWEPRSHTAAAAHLPMRVAALPTRVDPGQLVGETARSELVPLGLGGDDASVVGLHPRRDGRSWLVAGAAGSGVSTALALVAQTLARQGRPLAVVSAGAGPLDNLRSEPAVRLWVDVADPGELVSLRRAEPRLAVVVDDADRLVDTPVDDVLRQIASLVDRDSGLVVCGADVRGVATQYRGLAVGVARARTGVLLGPTSAVDGDVFGLRLAADPTAPPGRGHLVRRGRVVPVQLAAPSELERAGTRPAATGLSPTL